MPGHEPGRGGGVGHVQPRLPRDDRRRHRARDRADRARGRAHRGTVLAELAARARLGHRGIAPDRQDEPRARRADRPPDGDAADARALRAPRIAGADRAADPEPPHARRRAAAADRSHRAGGPRDRDRRAARDDLPAGAGRAAARARARAVGPARRRRAAARRRRACLGPPAPRRVVRPRHQRRRGAGVAHLRDHRRARGAPRGARRARTPTGRPGRARERRLGGAWLGGVRRGRGGGDRRARAPRRRWPRQPRAGRDGGVADAPRPDSDLPLDRHRRQPQHIDGRRAATPVARGPRALAARDRLAARGVAGAPPHRDRARRAAVRVSGQPGSNRARAVVARAARGPRDRARRPQRRGQDHAREAALRHVSADRGPHPPRRRRPRPGRPRRVARARDRRLPGLRTLPVPAARERRRRRTRA